MPLIATIVGGLGSVRDTLMMRGFIDGQSPFDLKRPAGNEVDVRKDKTFSFQEAGTQLG
jgi:hypothetical protein